MSNASTRPIGFRTPLLLLLLLAAVVALVQLGTASAEAKGKVKVTAKIKTKNQADLLERGKLKVKLRIKGGKATRIKAKAKSGKGKNFKNKKRKHARRGARLNLRLTAAGQSKLGACGTQKVKVTTTYKLPGSKKKHKVKAKRKLNPDSSRCVPVENADRCDFLDPAVCLQPWPDDYFTREDPATATGKRLNLNPESMPANKAGVHLDPTDINRADGFSPGNEIIIKIPGLETPAAFANSGLVPIDDLHAYDDPDQAVIVINAKTGERQPIWAELDSNPTTVDPSGGDPGGINANPGNTGDVNLIIRPARNFDFGGRYIVALRNLRDASDKPIEAPIGFRVYRDDQFTGQPEVESRRPHMESVINDLVTKAGVQRDSLYMAWDFTVASEQSVTGRATTIRDDAFKRLGDNDLADRKIEGSAPNATVTSVLNPGDPVPPDDRSLPTGIARRVYGTIEVPCYLNQDGCPTGAKFAHDANGEITWNPSYSRDVEWRCEIPDSVVAGGTLHPAAVGTYGHGLLGTQKQLTGQADLADNSNTIYCAMDWEGFAEQDLPTVISALADMSNFDKVADRMQQGFVEFMYLGRALIHPNGLATKPAFQMDPDGAGGQPAGSVIDTSAGNDTRLLYMGVSQGAIMGGALTALDPDVDRGVLNVTGMNYSTLLRRSVDSDEYFKLPGLGLYANYPDELTRPLLLSLIQLLWDRGEANGYAHNMTTDPLPNTNPHEVLLQAAIGDHQVTNVSAEVEARTVGAAVYSPALEPGRHWEANPFLDLNQVSSFPYTGGSMLVYYDGGPVGFFNPSDPSDEGSGTPPDENVPPRPEWGYGGDPHGYPRRSADGLAQEQSFLAGSGVPACSDADGYCFSNGYTGTP